ncbi:hypothetical protein KY343_03215 [Candidatus Woesearchaeota archaeon]|nr:hypothetical protein [Candidatus Woesearchaeota archaeon]
MTKTKYSGIVGCAGEFVLTLGHLPENCPENYADNEKAALAERIREDTRRVTEFHPEIDPSLLRVELTLEEVIRYGMQTKEIEFFHGTFGVIAERCYQTREGANLPDRKILLINNQVYDEYKDLADLASTKKTYIPLRLLVEGVKRFAALFS